LHCRVWGLGYTKKLKCQKGASRTNEVLSNAKDKHLKGKLNPDIDANSETGNLSPLSHIS